jgi:putative transcriptional regulator
VRTASWKFRVDARRVTKVRADIGLSQPKLARLMDIDVGTLRNGEQGRREPSGPAKALLQAIAVDPEHVLKAQVAAQRALGHAQEVKPVGD